jgi:aminopeptidase N
MLLRLVKRLMLLILVTAIVSGTQAAEVSIVEFESHDIRLILDVPSHAAIIKDEGLMQMHQGWNLFQLNRMADIDSFTVADSPLEYLAIQLKDTSTLPSELITGLPEIETEGKPQLIFFKSNQGGAVEFSLNYRAEFYQDVSNTRFSNEMVGKEVTGTISEQGAYLSPDAFFYPCGEETLSKFTLTADIPEEWESVSDGNRLSTETRDGRKIQAWQNPFESDGNMFFAALFVVKSTWVDSIEVACYFFEADTGLIDDYLTATANYIEMYSDLIGPYPYRRFTVVENFFPTGYGMPAWTLLGQQVLRLPFIIRTSLGHEVLHNWWGNSVYVDYDRGNWCEGATVYGADYRYKLIQSPTAARDYRKDILKQYVSYVNEGNDFPIRQFQSRTSPNTRTIGYNKAMMVYHMIEEEIGTSAFFNAWKLVYDKYRGQQISWEEWMDAFEESSGISLSHIIPQWIDRAGAPILDMEIINNVARPDKQTRSVEFKLMEKSGQGYRLKVPLRFSGENVALDTSAIVASEESVFTMTVPGEITALEVDPEYHLFRKLYPQEVEPVISAILGNPQKRFVSFASNESADEQYKSFGVNMTEDSVTIDSPEIFQSESRAYVPVMLNPKEMPEYLRDMVSLKEDTVVIDNTGYPREGHTFVLTGEKWNGFEKYMVLLTEDLQSLPRLGQLIPHYGKYSFLVFEGSRNVGKGQWPVKQSPLKKRLS